MFASSTDDGSWRPCGYKKRHIALASLALLLALAAAISTIVGGDADYEIRTLAVNALVVLLMVGLVWYEYNVYGISIALSHGLAAGAAAWLLSTVTVDGIALSVIIAQSVWSVGFALAAMAACVLTVLCTVDRLGIFPCHILDMPTEMLVLGAFLTLGFGWLAFQDAEVFGKAYGAPVVFLVVFGLIRFFLDGEPSLFFPNLERVAGGSSEYAERLEYFNRGCQAWADKYDFGLEVRRIWRVKSGEEEATPPLRRTNEGQHLFHGTNRSGCKGILSDGFRLPEHGGMFGTGIYFADCPLKSWQYCGVIANMISAYVPCKLCRRHGFMFMCWVELGRSYHAKDARPNQSRAPRRGPLDWLRGKRKYDSITGDTEDEGGALRVPEYIIYDPAKVEVDYLFEVTTTRKPPTPPAT